MTDLGPPLWACVGGKATIIMDVEDLREHPELIARAEEEAGRLTESDCTVAECVARADSYAKGMEAAAKTLHEYGYWKAEKCVRAAAKDTT